MKTRWNKRSSSPAIDNIWTGIDCGDPTTREGKGKPAVSHLRPAGCPGERSLGAGSVRQPRRRGAGQKPSAGHLGALFETSRSESIIPDSQECASFGIGAVLYRDRQPVLLARRRRPAGSAGCRKCWVRVRVHSSATLDASIYHAKSWVVGHSSHGQSVTVDCGFENVAQPEATRRPRRWELASMF